MDDDPDYIVFGDKRVLCNNSEHAIYELIHFRGFRIIDGTWYTVFESAHAWYACMWDRGLNTPNNFNTVLEKRGVVKFDLED